MIVTTDGWWNSPTGETYREFIDSLRTDGFLLLDVESMPGFDPGEMHIPDDGHWNQAGHEFVAKKIKDFIESNQLLGDGDRPERSSENLSGLFVQIVPKETLAHATPNIR